MSQKPLLVLNELSIKVEEKTILEKITWELFPGKTYLLVGPNGAGKSSLLQALAGDPRYHLQAKVLKYKDEELASLSPEDRALKGIFLAFQQPKGLPIKMIYFLKESLKKAHSYQKKKFPTIPHLLKEIKEKMQFLNLPERLLQEPLYENASGGEKKRGELLQLLLLMPDLCLLDEIDSGMDVAGRNMIAEVIHKLNQAGKTVLLVSHSNAMLETINLAEVMVLSKAGTSLVGDKELALKAFSKATK